MSHSHLAFHPYGGDEKQIAEEYLHACKEEYRQFTFTTKEAIKALGLFLQSEIEKNARLGEKCKQSFFLLKTYPIDSYLQRIAAKVHGLDETVILTTKIYMDRYLKLSQDVLTEDNVLLLLVTCMSLAMKWLDKHGKLNKTLASVAVISERKMARDEWALYKLMWCNLFVSHDITLQYEKQFEELLCPFKLQKIPTKVTAI